MTFLDAGASRGPFLDELTEFRRDAVKVLLSPEGRRMLRALVRRKKQPQSEVIEQLIRREYGER